mgnify:CR=1 FL=1
MIALPSRSTAEIAAWGREHLQAVVAIESSSDESSDSVPSTDGQRVLSRYLESFFAGHGCDVTVDAHANVIARLPGRGALADAPPLALMIHLDTARGTEAREGLELLPAWDGTAIPYPDNDALQVTVANYPSTARYLGHDLLYGGGQAPFGLDDKLGLAHMMTLARLLADDRSLPHRPLLFIGRPDEEIGREEALLGLAKWLSEQGVDSGYTVDGIDPFEVNVENFNGMAAAVRFADREDGPLSHAGRVVAVTLRGVNTHGATAKAEGHRGAVRLAAELVAALPPAAVHVLAFVSDDRRDCDGTLHLWLDGDAARASLDAALTRIVGPHVPRGAGWSVDDADAGAEWPHRGAAADMLRFVGEFIASRGDGPPLLCEDSDGFEGYTYPYRAREVDGRLQLDFRIRDFDRAALQARRDVVIAMVRARLPDAEVDAVEQYGNMGPRLAARPDLLERALEAARDVGIEAERRPIRGGTGVDPFLDEGVFVANLGTGYFAPESEKEFTSMQLLAQHALWLTALVQR